MNESQRLRRFAFRSPRYYLVIPLIAILPLLVYVFSRNIYISLIYSLAIVSTITWDYASAKIFKFRFPINRVFFLNAVSLYAATVFYLIVVGIRFLGPTLGLLLSVTTIPFIRTMVFLTFTGRRVALTHSISIAFPLFLSLYIFILYGRFDIFIAPIIISSVIYSISAHLFVKFSVSNFAREFSTDPIRILNEIVNSVTSEISYNAVLKKFFEDIYTTLAPREVSVLKLSTDSSKVTLVFPYVHPGPLGELGSSNITGKLQRAYPSDNLMVFHTTTTHDDNCAGDSEVEKISKVLALDGEQFDYCYEPYFGDHLTFLPLGEGGIFFLSPDNPRFDDVKISEGRKIVKRAKSLGLKWAITVDQHNNNMEKPEELTDISYLLKEADDAVKRRKVKRTLKSSFSWSVPKLMDIGPGGIAFLSLIMGIKKVAVILFDGNNMQYELRRSIESKLLGFDKILICTTDNHIVNTNGLNVNPVGASSNHDEIVNLVLKLAESSRDPKDTIVERVKRDLWLKIAGENQWEKLNKTIRRSANKAKVLSALAVLLSLALSLTIFKILN
ncbi:MAG: DUF2070 family protein [Thermoplasmatales archaeon]